MTGPDWLPISNFIRRIIGGRVPGIEESCFIALIKRRQSKLKESPNATYTINGYADSATGTPAFNQKLSLEDVYKRQIEAILTRAGRGN